MIWWVDLDMSKYIQLLLLICLALGKTYDPVTGEDVSNQSITEEKSILNKHNLSVGMFDDRTGISVIGYTYNLKQTKMDEYFIGAGTVFLAMTGTYQAGPTLVGFFVYKRDTHIVG